MEKIKLIWKNIKENQRYVWVFLVLLLVFLVNKAFPADVITSDDCAGGKCQMILEEPSLGKNDTRFYINDIFDSKKDSYYRLTFREKTNKNTRLVVKVTEPLDREQVIGEIDLKKNYQENFHEIIFSTNRKYTDLLFEKPYNVDDSEITISTIKITPLNIASEQEARELNSTIYTKSIEAGPSENQEKNNYAFSHLKEPDIIFGEVFKNNVDFITEIELDLDIVKQGDGGGEKFRLILREADITPEITSHTVSKLKFSFNSIEQYRQENGKFKFPIFARVKRGEFYFIGINNDRVEVNEFNHLLIRGAKDQNSYQNGITVIKKDGQTYPAMGDIYFKIFGITFDQFENQRILVGETIEDIGGGQGIFKFQPVKNRLALLDLYDYSENIDFDDDKKIIYEKIDSKKENFYTYYFETFYPFNSINIKGKKLDPKWSNLKLFYSFDEKKWQEIPADIKSIEDNTSEKEIFAQFFDFILEIDRPRISIYLKIVPTEFDKEKFGIENMEVTANLTIKK